MTKSYTPALVAGLRTLMLTVPKAPSAPDDEVTDIARDLCSLDSLEKLRLRLPKLVEVVFEADWEVDDSGRQFVSVSSHTMRFEGGEEFELSADPEDNYSCGMDLGSEDADVNLAFQAGLVTQAQRDAWLDIDSDQEAPEEIEGLEAVLRDISRELYRLRDLVIPDGGETPVSYARLRERLGITE